ncbi:glycoside hydrolase superfamily [Xylariaceae sp. FL0255]|nr:glycoside hydrolase superfamily [Xylariaceae sp. FL0255]
MKGAFAVAALAAGASAGSVHHRHNHGAAHDLAKKGYSTSALTSAESTCGATTIYSTFWGSPTLVYPTTSSSSTTSTSTVAPTTTSTPAASYSVAEYPTTSPAAPTTYPATTYAASTTTSEASYPTSSTGSSYPTGGSGSSGSGSSVPGPGVAGKPWGVTYTPYETDSSGGCKTQEQVNSDIAAIAAAGITTLRVYSTDCSTLPFVGSAAASHGIKMILGIYIDAPGCTADSPSVSEQIASIKAWGQWDMVSAIMVGNEATEDGFCTPSELASLIQSTKSQLSYTGPYSTSETVNIWQLEEFTSVVCDVVDFVGANAHAYFNTQTTAAQAGQFVQSQLDIIDSVCSGKEGRIMETGWPTQGVALGAAVPGVEEQYVAIKSIVEMVGDKAVLFSLTSDAWKGDSTACQCEAYWGCASVLGINLSS